MLKPSENPPISWPDKQSIVDFNGQWWVAHTKSRNEKTLAFDLIAKRVYYFLPMSWKSRRVKGRKLKSLLPLFSGYLFFCGDENKRVEVLKTNRVANIIEVNDQNRLVKELSQIEKAIKAGTTLQPHQYIKTGQRCRVKEGLLANLEGIAVKIKNTTRMVLQIDMLGQATSVEIDSDLIEILD